HARPRQRTVLCRRNHGDVCRTGGGKRTERRSDPRSQTSLHAAFALCRARSGAWLAHTGSQSQRRSTEFRRGWRGVSIRGTLPTRDAAVSSGDAACHPSHRSATGALLFVRREIRGSCRLTEPFVLGVNYWPRRKAMYWWSNFDAGEVREEFSLIRELGLNVVRLFLLWDDFQPTPDTVSSQCLDHLAQVCDIAADNQLGLNVTFFTGHMSGPNWSPRWMLDKALPLPMPDYRQVVSRDGVFDGGYRNMFSDPLCLEAERLLLRTVVGNLKDHPGIWAWNLGNEPDLFAFPPDASSGRAWVREMTSLIREIDGKHPVTCGLHIASLMQDNGLRVHDVFGECDFSVMHAYPMYSNLAKSPLDTDFVPFTCALTAALSGKKVLMEEWGGCTAPAGEPSTVWEWTAYGSPRKQFMASEEALAEYVAGVLPKLVEVGATG